MASGTADLQRDLGGALMQSIFGALLTAGYATAMAKAIGTSAEANQVTSSTQAQLTKSFDGAESIAHQYPQYSSQITAAARQSFLQGDSWAYLAGAIAVAFGALIVWRFYPRHEREIALREEYAAEAAQPVST
jgi:MFS transporter, DHA2 family, multidrug resistance protein